LPPADVINPGDVFSLIPSRGANTMLETIAVLLIILWLLGLFTSYTLGGLIHILLVIAVVAILLRLISGRRI
jgi:hypothetical protein